MRRWPPATAPAGRADPRPAHARASTASACCGRCAPARPSPVPVVVVSAFSPAHGARAVDALAEGALDLVAKPAMGESMADFTAELSKKVNDAAVSGKMRARRPRVAPAPIAPRPPVRAARPRSARRRTRKFVVIASSTGGPKALGELIPKLPSPLGTGSLIVQHMPAGFTASLATRLDGMSQADRPRGRRQRGDGPASHVPRPRRLAPAHGRRPQGPALSDEAPMGGLRPRADLTIADAAKLYGNALVLVVLTGMGKDGLDGRPRRQEGRRPHPGRGRVHLRRLRHAARRRRGRPGRRDPPPARTARRDRPRGRRMSHLPRPPPPLAPRRARRCAAHPRAAAPRRARRHAGAPRAPAAGGPGVHREPQGRRLHRPVRARPHALRRRPRPVQAQPDGAPRPHVDRAPRHAGPRRVRQAPAQGLGRAGRLPGPRDDQRLAPVAPRGPVRGRCARRSCRSSRPSAAA